MEISLAWLMKITIITSNINGNITTVKLKLSFLMKDQRMTFLNS